MRLTRLWSAATLILALAVTLQACDESTTTTTPEPDAFTLSVTLDGLGFGTVTSEPAGIACDTTGDACSAEFEEGTSVTLTATADEGSEFMDWGEDGTANPLTLTVDADRSVTAEFDNPDLAMESVGADGGEVTSRDSVVTLVFPAGALTGDEEITIERLDPSELGDEWADYQGEGEVAWAYDLGPDGLQFSEPVEVRLNPQTVATESDTVELVIPDLASGSSGEVSALDSVSADLDMVTGELGVVGRLWHFSTLTHVEGPGDFLAVALATNHHPVTDAVPVGDYTQIKLVATTDEWATTFLWPTEITYTVTGPARADILYNEGNTLEPSFAVFCEGSGAATITVTAVFALESGETRTMRLAFTVDCVGTDLTVTTSGQGSGTVTGPDAFGETGGINCGSQGDDCAEEYGPGQEVTLTGTPDEGSFLDGWRIDGQFVANDGTDEMTITMDENTTVDAVFEPIPDDELSLLLSGADGTVTSDPAGIDCTKEGETVTGDCAATFPSGSTVQLTATTPDGSTATDWSGDGTTNALGQRVLEMVSALSVGMAFPVVPSATTVLDLAAHSLWYLEALSLVNLAFPFVQPSADLAWETAGEACPTVLIAADAMVGAVDACDGSLVQSYSSTTTLYDAYALPRPEGEETGDHAIFATGHDYQFFWVDDTGEVTAQVRQTSWGTVPDATPINGNPADGLAMIRYDGSGHTVRFVRYDPAKGYHDLLTDFVGVTTTPPNAQSVFAAGLPDGDPTGMPEEMLVVGNTSNDGVLYYIETVSETDPTWQEVGNLGGDNPRRIRCDLESGICAVSDFANSLVTVITWSGTGMPTIGASTTAGQIASGPVGLDVYGSYIVTAGYNDDSYSIIEVDGSGNVVNTTTTALPAECSAPGHATFLRDASHTVMVSCNASQAVVRIPNAF